MHLLALALTGLAAPQLSLDEPFPAIGTTATYTLSGTSGAAWLLYAAPAPAELDLGPAGTLFLDPLSMFFLGAGAVPAGGALDVPLAIPADPTLEGAFLHAQAGLVLPPDVALSNAVTLRIEPAAPSGARRPAALAVHPDGSTAYALSRRDGALFAIDVATDAVRAEIPVAPASHDFPDAAVDVAVDPEGRHVFALHANAGAIAVLDAESLSVAAFVPVPKGCRRLGFDFGGPVDRVYVTNEREEAVLVLEELAPGFFLHAAPIALGGVDPDPIAVLADGRLVVGDRGTRELELVDPALPPGAQVVQTLALGSLPLDVVELGGEVLVPTFSPTPGGPTDGSNEVLRVDLASFTVAGSFLVDDGTDYLDLALAGSTIGVVGAGSGTLMLVDAAGFALLDRVDLAPGVGFTPNAIPQRAAFVAPGGVPTKAYVVNPIRETVRAVDLAAGPPFALGAEIALAHSGAPRVPLQDLSDAEDGEWFFRSVLFFNGTPTSPNPVTCFTCHPEGGSDGLLHLGTLRQAPVLFDGEATPPFGWNGNLAQLAGALSNAFVAHGIFPGSPPAGAEGLLLDFVADGNPPPPSPYLEPDGSLDAAAQAGEAVFEGAAGCATCHAAPLFVPPAPSPATIPGGVGTGLAPANVPSLRSVWASAPYLHDGSAATLRDVILQNPGDQHGQTSGLDAQEIDQLVAYLRSL